MQRSGRLGRRPPGELPALLLACCAPALAQAAPPVRYVNTHEVAVAFQAADGAAVERVRLWLSRDGGDSWSAHVGSNPSGAGPRFEVTEDGLYDVYVVLEGAAGASGPAPAPGAEPHLRVVVDTRPPIVQIHRVDRSASGDGVDRLDIDVSLYEPHLADGGIRLFFRAAGAADWRDGGPVLPTEGRVAWSAPPDLERERIDLRIVVTDLAGNRAVDDFSGVHPQPAAGEVAVRAAASQPAAAAPATQPVPVASTETGPERAGGPLSTESTRRAASLREVAAQFASQGLRDLALARLNEALALAPNDVDAHVEVGQLLYELQRIDEAGTQFTRAAELAPRHAGALEGLALTAVTQHRYSDARAHLKALLESSAESALTWLRLGDVEHRLGRREAAVSAWKRAGELVGDDAALRERIDRRLRSFQPATAPAP
jgi:hypothetical protein